jgi:hypothetical protein
MSAAGICPHISSFRPSDLMFRWCVAVGHNWSQCPGAWIEHLPAHLESARCADEREADLARLVRWLDARKRPLLVEMPEAELRRSLPGLFAGGG